MKRRTSWIGFGLALIFLALFLYRVDFRQLGQVMRQANYSFIVPAILVYFVGVWFRALRWHFLLLSLGNFPPHRLFSPIVIGFALNNILPARLGLIARAYLLGAKEGISKIASFATVVVDQLFDGLALLFFLGAIAIFVPLPPWGKAVALTSAIIFIGFFLVFLVLALSPRLTQWLMNKLAHRLPQRWQDQITQRTDTALSGLGSLRHPGKIALAFFLSLIVWLCEAAMYYIISLSFDLGQPFRVILLVTSIANIAITLPSLPGGIGPFEFFGKQTLTLFAVSEEAATAYVAVLHIALLLPVIAVGLALLAWSRISLTEVIGRSQGQK